MAPQWQPCQRLLNPDRSRNLPAHESAWLLLFQALCMWQQAERSARKGMSANVSHKGEGR